MADKFQSAVDIVSNLPNEGPIQPSQGDKLEFYANFKQATIGNVNTARPTGLFDMAGKAKWDAWKGREDISQEEAKKAYVDKLIAVLKSSEDNVAKEHLAKLQ